MSALDAFRAYKEPSYLYVSVAAAMKHIAFWCRKLGIDKESALELFDAAWDETMQRLGVQVESCPVSENGRETSDGEHEALVARVRELEATLEAEQREHRATLRLAEEGEFSDDEEAVMEERQRCLDIVTRMEQAAKEYPGDPTVAGFAEAVRRAIEAGTDAR